MERTTAASERKRRNYNESKIVSIYLRSVIIIALICISIFIVMPYLISAKSDELVLFGISYGICIVPIIYLLIVRSFKKNSNFTMFWFQFDLSRRISPAAFFVLIKKVI